jgi:hypothetical protein
VNYVSLRFHITATVSRRISFVALINVNSSNWFASKERGDDWVWGYHSPRPRHHRPFKPQPSISLSQKGRETKQSSGMVRSTHMGRITLRNSEIERWRRTRRLHSIPMSELIQSMPTSKTPSSTCRGLRRLTLFLMPWTILVCDAESTSRLSP